MSIRSYFPEPFANRNESVQCDVAVGHWLRHVMAGNGCGLMLVRGIVPASSLRHISHVEHLSSVFRRLASGNRLIVERINTLFACGDGRHTALRRVTEIIVVLPFARCSSHYLTDVWLARRIFAGFVWSRVPSTLARGRCRTSGRPWMPTSRGPVCSPAQRHLAVASAQRRTQASCPSPPYSSQSLSLFL